MSLGLDGAQILVTRPAAQADHLCRLIAQQGGEALRFPTLMIVENQPDASRLQAALSSDWLIFTSSNAVDFAIKAFGGKMQAFGPPQIAAVGNATAQALLDAGWPVDCVPLTDFSSEGLLAEAKLQQVAGKKCVIVRGVGGREKLAEALRERGADVSYLEVYSRCRPDTDNQVLTTALLSGQLAASTVTSVEALENLLAMLEPEAVECLTKILLVVGSERIGAWAGKLGFKNIAVSQQPTDAAILETLTTLLNGENSGRSK